MNILLFQMIIYHKIKSKINHNKHSLFLILTTTHLIIKTCSTPAVGLDKINGKILKLVRSEIATPISQLIIDRSAPKAKLWIEIF